MQEAYHAIDGGTYTAIQLEQFELSRRNSIVQNLRCEYCAEPAYYRSRSTNGQRRPCFFCRPHGENCQVMVQESDPWGDDDEARIRHASSNGGRLIIQIPGDIESSGVNDVSGEEASDQRTRSSRSGGGAQRDGNVRRGPQRILELLVNSPTFRTSASVVRFRDGSELPVHDAFVDFLRADSVTDVERWKGFWGVLPVPSRWEYGSSYYFNFGPHDSDFRIALSDQTSAEVLARYGLSSVFEMAGCRFLLFDIARLSNSGRFTADIRSVNHIGLLRG